MCTAIFLKKKRAFLFGKNVIENNEKELHTLCMYMQNFHYTG